MAYFVLAAIPVLLIVLVLDLVAPSVAFVALAFLFELLGVIDLTEFLGSYVNPTLMTLVILLLASVAIERTTIINYAAKKLIAGSEGQTRFSVIGTSALLSAFINNTAVVSSFLSTIAIQKKINPSRLLIPLSYASVLGGVTTLIGTSTNLIVNSFVVDYGHSPIGLFTFAWVGIPIALGCLPLLYFMAKYLPERAPRSLSADQRYFIVASVNANSNLIEKTVQEIGLRDLNGLYLLEIERDNRLITPVFSHQIIRKGDALIFTGSLEQVNELKRFPGLEIMGEEIGELLSSNLIEVVVANDADILHRTIRQVDFRTMFNAGVVAIRRRNKPLKGKLGQRPLKVGDCLVLATGPDFLLSPNVDKNFHILDKKKRKESISAKKSYWVIGGFLTAILASGFGLLPLFNSLALLLAAYVASGCISYKDLKNRFPFELLIIIGSSLAISKAMMNSGAAEIIGNTMQILFAQVGVYGALIGIYILTLVLTEIVTNNAAAAISTPIALSTAQTYGVDIMPFVMCVAYAASACFLLPFGYQTHLMVYSPGKYQIRDFFLTGLPISLLYSLLVLTLVPLAFPF